MKLVDEMNGLMLLAATIHKNSLKSTVSKRKFQDLEIDDNTFSETCTVPQKLAKLTSTYWKQLSSEEKETLSSSSSKLWICNPYRNEGPSAVYEDIKTELSDPLPDTKSNLPRVKIESKYKASTLKKKKSNIPRIIQMKYEPE